MTANELLAWEAVRRAFATDRYRQDVAYKMIATLNRADAEIFAQLAARLAQMDADSYSTQRLEQMLVQIRMMIMEATQAVEMGMAVELQGYVAWEAEYQRELLVTATGARIPIASLHPEAVYAAAMSRPFQGNLLRDSLGHLGDSRARKMRQAIATGYMTGETTDSIVRRLAGTRAKGYADGLWEGSRRELQTIVRTAVQHHARFTIDKMNDANADIIKAVVWHSTLDSRTSDACQQRDLKRYTPVTHKPIGHSLPWCVKGKGCGPGGIHWNCRSSSINELKSNAELGIDLPEFSDKGRQRASVNGPVDHQMSYGQWLRDQPQSVQVEALGKARAKAFRDGMELEQLFSVKGDRLTLAQLRDLDRKALQAA